MASLDEGYTDEDGTYENKGDDVVADLREATSINWVIVDTEEEAKGGVESGDYYAAVVIDKQFSRNMYRMLTDWTGKPAITYYENAKKNAVATKITDTAVETLKRSISENYLEVVIDGIMEQSNLLAADLTADDPEAAVKGVLYQAQDLLHACGRMMDAFEAAGGSGVSESSAAVLEAAVASINKNLPDGAQLQQTAAEIQMRLNTALARVERALDRLSSAIGNAPELPSAQQKLLDAADTMDKTADALETWAAGLEASGTEAGKTQAEAARQTAAECRKTAKQLRALAESPDSADLLADCDALVKSIRTMVDKIPVTSKALQKELDTVAGQVADTMEGMAALAGDAKVMKTALAETADAVGDTMALLRPATEKLLTSLESTIDDLEGLTTDEYMDTLVDILGGDPAVYGQYFPEMVQTSVNAVYPIANYGSAMTPFYTVLAIWVGGVILSSSSRYTPGRRVDRPEAGGAVLRAVLVLFRAEPDTGSGHRYRRSVHTEGPVPAPGDVVSHGRADGLYLQPADLFAGAVLRRCGQGHRGGHHGHADRRLLRHVPHRAAAGHLPEDLSLLPFPYAIDAMRECICGMYGNYYWQQIGFLLLSLRRRW
ncbi:MAG: hypothetical protein ACLUE5_06235 [Dysosmobacter sp.]